MKKNEKKGAAQHTKELETLRQRVAQLETIAGELRTAEDQAAWLATFPEQNPNPVIETDSAGKVTYLNPVAEAQFPQLWAEGFSHPILKDLKSIVAAFQTGEKSYVAREIDLSAAVYEQKICYTANGNGNVRIRVYVHDITRRKRAEEAIHKLARRIVFAQEDERRRLSRELHDEAGQALTALKLSLDLIRRELPPEIDALRRELDEAVALTESTKERIRLLARGLRPPALDTLGLNLTLEAFCRDFSKHAQLSVCYEGTEVSGLSDVVSICLYRILQEALTNVLKHARATEADVKLLLQDHTVSLVVTDNGRGPKPESGGPWEEQPTGIGLLGMQERLELLGGWLEVNSEPGQGLSLAAHLPFKEDAT